MPWSRSSATTWSMPFFSMVRRPLAEIRRETQRFSVSTQNRWVCRFGRKRRRFLLLACETRLPTPGLSFAGDFANAGHTDKSLENSVTYGLRGSRPLAGAGSLYQRALRITNSPPSSASILTSPAVPPPPTPSPRQPRHLASPYAARPHRSVGPATPADPTSPLAIIVQSARAPMVIASPMLGERETPVIPDDDVVCEHPNIDQGQDASQTACCLLILALAGFVHSRWMVVRQNHSRCIVCECVTHDFPRMHRGQTRSCPEKAPQKRSAGGDCPGRDN